MQVTKGTWRMREQCVPGSLSSSPTREPGNEAMITHVRSCARNLRPQRWPIGTIQSRFFHDISKNREKDFRNCSLQKQFLQWLVEGVTVIMTNKR